MNSFAIQPRSEEPTRDEGPRKPTREEGLAIAAQRKAARRRRTGRIRKMVAVVAVSAFIGPFAVIYTQVAAGKDPVLVASVQRKSATTTSASTTAAGSGSTTGSTGSTSSGSTPSGSTSSGSTSSPAAVTTQQS